MKTIKTNEYKEIKDKKVNLDFSTNSILKEAVDYGEQTKIEINFDKKNNKEKLVDEVKLIEDNYLYQNNDYIGYAPKKEEEYTVLSLLSKIIKDKGIETAVYKESSQSMNDSVIQMMCSNLLKKYDFIFDFGDEENKKILESKYYYTGIDYSELNMYLWKSNRNDNKFYNSYIWCLHSTLRNYYKDVNTEKIQLVKDGTMVYRKCYTFDFKKYGKGSQYYFSSFVSTSLDENTKEKFDGKCFMRIIIKNNEKNNYFYLIENVSEVKHEKY